MEKKGATNKKGEDGFRRFAQDGFPDLGVFQQLGGVTAQDELPGPQHVGVLGDLHGLLDVLLHQEDRGPFPVDAVDDTKRKISFTTRGARPSEGSSSKSSWAGEEGPGDGQHLLLPAGREPPGCPCCSFGPGKARGYPFQYRP